MAKHPQNVETTDAARAEREGDFRRARALTRRLLAAAPQVPLAGGVGEGWAVAQDRLARLGLDPAGWLCGLAAMLLYAAVWVYALHANQ